MSKEDRIWREGDPHWEWIQGEPVPRYMWSQVPRSFVVGRLNHTTELEQQVEALTKRLQRARLDTVEFIHDEIIDGSETANEARRDVFNYYLKLQLEGKSKQEPASD